MTYNITPTIHYFGNSKIIAEQVGKYLVSIFTDDGKDKTYVYLDKPNLNRLINDLK